MPEGEERYSAAPVCVVERREPMKWGREEEEGGRWTVRSKAPAGVKEVGVVRL